LATRSETGNARIEIGEKSQKAELVNLISLIQMK
jgi:hypothetical protein